MLEVSQVPSSITAHTPGYIDRDNDEVIVGIQTEAPLKRAIMPQGGFRMVLGALKTYGYEPDPHVVEAFTKDRKTHNGAVFDDLHRGHPRCRSSHVLAGLPDAYGRSRIIGDYRRVALYGNNAAPGARAAGDGSARRGDVDRGGRRSPGLPPWRAASSARGTWGRRGRPPRASSATGRNSPFGGPAARRAGS